MNTKARALISQFEGCKLTSYQDSVGVWTVGYGHTTGVKSGQHITQQQADNFLDEDIEKTRSKVISMLKIALNENQESALISLAFNIGTTALAKSTLLKKLNANDITGAADEFLRWNKAGGQVLKGLTRRREAERKLFLTK